MTRQAITGDAALALTYLENWVCSSAKFRSLVGAASVAEAKSHVYFGEAVDTVQDGDEPGKERLVNPRPRAICSVEPASAAQYLGPGQRQWDYVLQVSFELIAPKELDYVIKDEELWFADAWGVIVSQMWVNVGVNDGTNPNLAASALQIVSGPSRCDVPEEIERFYGITFRVTAIG